MMYQFMDWRIGFHRRMLMVRDVAELFRRLREDNEGVLPYCLTRWDQVLAFAGESGIPLPEHQGVAETLMATDAYPTVQWVREQYEAFLKWMAGQKDYKSLLEDPPKQVPVPPPSSPATFTQLVEGSVSNTESKACSEPAPETLSPSAISTGSPNSLLTARPTSPQKPSRPSTPTPRR